MDKILLFFIIMAGICILIVAGMVGLKSNYAEHVKITNERASKAPEVAAFYQKYDNVERNNMDLNMAFFTSFNGTDRATLYFYAGPVDSARKVTFACYPSDVVSFDYFVDGNVLDYIENYNCFTDNYCKDNDCTEIMPYQPSPETNELE